ARTVLRVRLEEGLLHAALEVGRGRDGRQSADPLELGQFARAGVALLVMGAEHRPFLLRDFAPEVARDLGRLGALGHVGSATDSNSFSFSIAVCMRDFTVPTGTSRIAPISWYFMPSISLRITTAFCSSGSWSIARRRAACCSSFARISGGSGDSDATRSPSERPSPPSARPSSET